MFSSAHISYNSLLSITVWSIDVDFQHTSLNHVLRLSDKINELASRLPIFKLVKFHINGLCNSLNDCLLVLSQTSNEISMEYLFLF